MKGQPEIFGVQGRNTHDLVDVKAIEAPLNPPLDRRANDRGSRAQILSVVCVLNGRHAEGPNELLEVHRELLAFDMPTELVAVLNGCDSQVVALLRDLTAKHDGIQAYVLKYHVDYATALVAGIENAIGDWVAMIDIGADDPAVIRSLFDCALTRGSEVVLGIPKAGPRPILRSIGSSLFHRTFEAIHGFNLMREAPSARLLSRTAVNAILRHDSPLVALETLTAEGGYQRSEVTSPQRNPVDRSFSERVRVRWRTLIGINALPLRLANLLCGVAAFGAFLYSILVVAVYLLKRDVMPGWTTVSLMLSLMFLMLALVLWLLSEYMLMLLDPTARRPKYEISEEFGGGIRRGGGLLNVETEL